MSQNQMNINDYVSLNLDKNDMSTPLNNLPGNYYQDANPSGTQMMDSLIQQMEQVPQSQPLMLSAQPQMPMQMATSQPQMPMGQAQMPMPMQMPMAQPQMQMPMSQPQMPQSQMQMPMGLVPTQAHQANQTNQTQPFIPTKKSSLEKEKAIKELEISSSEVKVSEKKQMGKLENSSILVPKSLTSNINETIVAVVLYALISNPFITPMILNYIPFFETSPNLLFVSKVILFAIIYHLVRWVM